MQESAPASDKIVVALAFGWGACTFFPVGIAYSCVLLMLAALLLRSGLGRRLAGLRLAGIWWPVGVFLGWTILVYLVGPGFPDSDTRVFHVIRVVLLIAMGLMLTPHRRARRSRVTWRPPFWRPSSWQCTMYGGCRRGISGAACCAHATISAAAT